MDSSFAQESEDVGQTVVRGTGHDAGIVGWTTSERLPDSKVQAVVCACPDKGLFGKRGDQVR